jgi:methylation protein EvaC
MFSCIICNEELEPLFSLGHQPLANKYPKSSDDFDQEILREMTVYHCDKCNYVNVPCDVDRSVFFEDYYYLSSVNRELVIHFEDLADQIKLRNPRFVLDVGSNDGVLLRPLQSRKVKCVGVDPSENVSAIANKEGLETIVGFFDFETAKTIEDKHGKPDLICASSVFTHLQDPRDFFTIADSLLAKNGEILVEVEYLGSIIETLGFERFYFDRPHYYSIKSLSRLAEQSGFVLVDISRIKAHGGSIRAIFSRSAEKNVSIALKTAIDKEDESLNRDLIQTKFESFKLACSSLVENLEQFSKKSFRIAAYGCPARFSTITNFTGIGRDQLPYVIDDSPLKQKRFSPGKHIPIVSFSSSETVDIFIVFSYEYIDSIKDKVDSKLIKYFKPIPFEAI